MKPLFETPDPTSAVDADPTESELAGYGQPAQLGTDPEAGAPVEPGSNWLALGSVAPDDLGEGGTSMGILPGSEDREDNGQQGATQENGGLGLGDEEGLGRTGLSESGAIGDQVSAPAPQFDPAPARSMVSDPEDIPENQLLTDETESDRTRAPKEPGVDSN